MNEPMLMFRYAYLAELQSTIPILVQAVVEKVKSFGKALDIRYRLIRGFGKVLGKVSLETRAGWRMGKA